ncbi:MAG TPA: hypothetical protein VJM49_03330, partial [Acidimicrobiales bacterium]|nr:hypothetical protein [Acidimicrobiales bacterium]
MPDKRNVSKQRRAARNRQTRDAMAARRENAVPPPPTSGTSGSGSARAAGTSSKKDAGTTSSARPARGRGTPRPRPVFVASEPPDPGLKGVITSKRPGDRWVLAAFLLAILSGVFALVATQISADDRGDALPSQFGGLTIAAREVLTGQSIGDHTVSMVDAYGPIAFLLVGTPVLITAFALWANRRPDRGRVLTYCLIAMAGAVMLSATSLFVFLPVIALGVATFRVRKTDMVLPDAPAAAPRGKGRDDAIEADTVDDEVDDDDEAPATGPTSFLDRLLGGGAAGRTPRARTPRDPAVAEEVADDEVIEADVV